jgi:hypothetical protein
VNRPNKFSFCFKQDFIPALFQDQGIMRVYWSEI